MTRRWTAMIAVLLAGAFLLAGCGYTTQSSLDPKYQTISVEAFRDDSSEYGLQAPLSNAVLRKFITDGRLRVVSADEADLLLEGVILNYRLRGLSYDDDDDVTQLLAVVTAKVRVTDQLSGEILWEESIMSGETSFYTRASGQSADRLRGNAEAFTPTVRSFVAEEENRAVSEALEQLASNIFYRTIDPW